MSDHPSFDDLILRLERGEGSAATIVFERFADRLVALARSRLNPQLLQKVDPEDVAQSVFRSFFQRHEAGKFGFDDWGGLWGLLVTMTVRKCGRRAEEFYAARRDVRRERQEPENSDGVPGQFEVPAPDPTPEEAAALTELVEQLMFKLDARGRQVLSLRLQGYTVSEISQQIGRTERTVHRTLEEIKQNVQR